MKKEKRNNNIYLFVGPSGSGKDTICDYLVKHYKFKKLLSYTTRPKRKWREKTHTFITKEQFAKLEDICAYTEYNGHQYGCTKEQIDNADLYIIDPPGIEYMKEKYDGDKNLIIVYVDTPFKMRVDRMLGRGDSAEAVKQRILFDEDVFADIKEKANMTIHNEGDLKDTIDQFLMMQEIF